MTLLRSIIGFQVGDYVRLKGPPETLIYESAYGGTMLDVDGSLGIDELIILRIYRIHAARADPLININGPLLAVETETGVRTNIFAKNVVLWTS